MTKFNLGDHVLLQNDAGHYVVRGIIVEQPRAYQKTRLVSYVWNGQDQIGSFSREFLRIDRSGVS